MVARRLVRNSLIGGYSTGFGEEKSWIRGVDSMVEAIYQILRITVNYYRNKIRIRLRCKIKDPSNIGLWPQRHANDVLAVFCTW